MEAHMAKTFEEVMGILKSLGTESRWKFNLKNGVGINQFGVGLMQMKNLAKELKVDHPLAVKLWETGNMDAMLLASMIMDPAKVPPDRAENMVLPLSYSPLIDELAFSTLINMPFANIMMQKWIRSSSASLGRVGWDLIIDRIASGKPLPMPIDNILADIESNMENAEKLKQEAMNRCLCEIGIRINEYTSKCIAIGEKIGRLDELSVSDACASSYAPEWIAAGLKLKEKKKAYT
jgi:3-methyladenine DNA glycosylase AlkD